MHRKLWLTIFASVAGSYLCVGPASAQSISATLAAVTTVGDYMVQTFTDDYRPVDGAYFPFRIRQVEKGNIFTVRITQIKNNPRVDDSVFLKTESANADR